MSGFFRVVSRYARPWLVEQTENRLTQVFAGVLQHSDGLAVELARRWLKPRPGDEGDAVTTREAAAAALKVEGVKLRHALPQVPTDGGWQVDLELRFRHPGAYRADDTVIWVEVKNKARPHKHQLINYLGDIEQLGVGATAVVLLAPRQSYPFDHEPPPEVLQRRWQDTAAFCARWARGRPPGVARFLTEELLDYLREENLMDPEVIGPLQLVALAEYQRANEAVKSVCETASGYIERHWNTRDPYEGSRPRYGVDYWETHPPSKRGTEAADWGDAWFDWGFPWGEQGLEGPRDGPFVACGVTAENSFFSTESSPWIDNLAKSHRFFEHFDGFYRFHRAVHPEQVLVGRTLEEQGEALGRWVVETYTALYSAGPPPSLLDTPRPDS